MKKIINKKDLEFVFHENHSLEYIEVKVLFKKGKTPKGLPRKIGFIILEKIEISKKTYYFIERSEISVATLHGQGIGTLLYEKCLEKYGNLCTDYIEHSTKANKVWQKLRNKYQGKYILHEKIEARSFYFVVFNKKNRKKSNNYKLYIIKE